MVWVESRLKGGRNFYKRSQAFVALLPIIHDSIYRTRLPGYVAIGFGDFTDLLLTELLLTELALSQIQIIFFKVKPTL